MTTTPEGVSDDWKKNNSSMFTEMIMDYYRNPQNYGEIKGADVVERDTNPLCGDEVKLFLELEDDKVRDVKFKGDGCAISMAATSLLTEHVKGDSFEEIRDFEKDEMLDLLGLDLSPIRLKCALLAFKTLKVGVYKEHGEDLDSL